jgi:hypothetical protein
MAGRTPVARIARRWRLACVLACAAPPAGCASQPPADAPRRASGDFAGARRRMVEQQLRRDGVRDRRVLAAMARVPRHRFVPPEQVPRRTTTRRCRSGSGRPSRSRTSSPS